MNLKAEISNLKRAFGIVFKEKKYYLITIAITIAIAAFLNFAVNLDFIISTFTSDYELSNKIYIFIGLFEGIFTTNTEATLLGITIVGILAGINTSFIIYKYRLERTISKTEGLKGAFGTFLGVFAGGCASCALSVAALLGVTSVLTFLPFNGSELIIVGILVLFLVLFSSARSVLGICNIEIQK